MSPSTVRIYAELLPHIRQLSVVVSLPTISTPSTRAVLTRGGTTVTVTHDGLPTSIELPARVADGRPLAACSSGKKVLSWRLAASDLPVRPSADDIGHTDNAPWNSQALSTATGLSCRKCANVVVSPGIIESWRDLPSENWAEMMDFWHCHKPHVDQHHNSPARDHTHQKAGYAPQQPADLSHKGYGANTKITARSKVGFVDLTSFLLFEDDCTGLKTTSSEDALLTQPRHDDNLTCAACGANIGAQDDTAGGYRLWKWNLSVSPCADGSASIYPRSYFLAAAILSKIWSQATRRFNLMPSGVPIAEAAAHGLHLWVLSTNIRYSCLSDTTTSPRAAIKIHYRAMEQSDAETDSTGLQANEAETLTFPREVIEEFVAQIRRSTLDLPDAVQKFGAYDIGLIDRYLAHTGHGVV